jgi:hypothetical protein
VSGKSPFKYDPLRLALFHGLNGRVAKMQKRMGNPPG